MNYGSLTFFQISCVSSKGLYYSYGAISTNEYNSFKQEKKYFQLSRTGEITNIKLIQDDIENEYWINSFVFDGNIYFSRPGYYSFNGLYELDSESGNLVLIEQTQAQEHSKSNGFIHGERNLYDFINSKYPPFEGSIVVYDKEFKVVNSINGVDTLNTKIYSNEDRELFYFQGKPMIDKIGIIDNIEATEPIQLADIKILRIISDESKVYVFGSDYKNEGKIGLYVVSEQMLISRKLTGLWVSPDWQSQGLSIHTGKRQDVSEYIFVSFYMYRDGNPFWVAGSHDIDSGTNSIEIDLFEFIGSSFLPNDSNYEYQSDTFGKIIIEPTSCNNMNVRIETVGSDTIDLSMRRIGDISNDMTCID